MDPAESTYTSNVSSGWAAKMGGMGLGKFIKLLIGVLVLLVVWQWVNSPMLVTVTGTGEVTIPATNATISLSVTDNDATPFGAVSKVNAKAQKIRAFLISVSVPEGNIAESQVVTVPAAFVTAGATGYQASISMALKTDRVANASTLVSDLYTNGATVVSQPVLSIENQDKLEQDAFDSALKDAKSQAAKIGTSNLKFIRKIVSISQVSSPSTSTATTKPDATNQNGVFKMVKAVSVSYKMW